MSLAQPTLDLLMLEQISILKTTLESLTTSINDTNESINNKLNILTDKVDKQDNFIKKILKNGINNSSNELIKTNNLNIDISAKIENVVSDINVNDKNIKLNRTEIENLYRIVNINKEDNKDLISSIKTKIEIISDNSSKNTMDIMDKLNSYINELKSPNSYVEITHPIIVNKNSNISREATDNANIKKYDNTYTKSYTNYNKDPYKSTNHKRYQSRINVASSDEDGWQTVKSKKKPTQYSRY